MNMKKWNWPLTILVILYMTFLGSVFYDIYKWVTV